MQAHRGLGRRALGQTKTFNAEATTKTQSSSEKDEHPAPRVSTCIPKESWPKPRNYSRSSEQELDQDYICHGLALHSTCACLMAMKPIGNCNDDRLLALPNTLFCSHQPRGLRSSTYGFYNQHSSVVAWSYHHTVRNQLGSQHDLQACSMSSSMSSTMASTHTGRLP